MRLLRSTRNHRGMTRFPPETVDLRSARHEAMLLKLGPDGARSRESGPEVMDPAIWHTSPDLSQANEMSANCAIGRLGIEFTEYGADHLTARMPVDSRTHQPLGILHGG